MYLEEISEHLVKGRAVVMVGAGFSKNAVKTTATDKYFLNWNELGDIFYKKIYGRTPKKGQEHYLDPVKLASIVESVFGRPVLDQLLLEHLPDEEYSPGELHKQLLSLNWADIFTTNYDTLLERTRKYVPNRRYQSVLRMEDLVYSSCPRIIKLHGSFPSYRPFVISQEDYRKYPKDYAVFVNTVQQALIENIFCLIGFSGDDPNFLSWIGWIQDNLGIGYHSKIYLITMEQENRIENILLSSRNIVVVNLFELIKREKVSYQNGFRRFFEELQKRQKNITKKEWIKNAKGISFRGLQKSGKQKKLLKELYDFWKSCQQNYPGWIVAPLKERDSLEKSLKEIEQYDVWELLKRLKDTFSEDKDFLSVESFVQLYDWIRQICLLPLTEKMQQLYEKILETDVDSTEICALRLSLLTYYRKNGNNKEFINHDKKLRKTQMLTAEQIKQYQCERAMFFLYSCDYEALDRELAEWPLTTGNFSYELSHIGMMWEVEQYRQGLDMLVAMIDSIRSIGNNETDLKALSQEAYALNLLNRAIPQVEFLSLNTHPIKFSQGNREKMLKADSCDPEKEIELFRALLAYTRIPEREKELFRISAQFINYLERTGNFLVIGSKLDYEKELKRAIEQIIKWNYYWGVILSIRTRDDRFIRQMAVRGSLYIKNDEIEHVVKHFCDMCKSHIFSVAAGMRLKEQRNRYRVWGEYLPIVLGALVHRCKNEMRKSILELAKEMLEISDCFEELSFLGKNIYRSLNRPFIIEHGEKLLKFIMNIKNEKDSDEILTLDFCDFMLYDLESIKTNLPDKLDIELDCFGKEFKKQTGIMCVKSLLYHLGMLHEEQSKQFVLDVECSIKKTEFSLDFYSYVFDIVKKENEQKETIKKWILKKLIRLLACVNSDAEECVFLVQIFEKIIRLFRQYEFKWTTEDVGIVLKQLHELVTKKNNINSNQYYILFSNYYWLLLEMLSQKEWTLLTNAYEKNEELWFGQNYMRFTKKVLQEKDISKKKCQIFDEIYGTDGECFVGAVCIFVKYLGENTDDWKNHLRELEISLASVVREQGKLAPFCIDAFRILVRVREKQAYEMNAGIIRRILESVYDLEPKSSFLLIQKIYGARLAYDCSLYMQESPEVKECVKKWKDYVSTEEVHTLIAKQWETC